MTDKDQRLASLKKSISEMSDEELLKLLDGTRNNRRPPAKKTKVKTTGSKNKDTGKMTLKMASKLSPEQAKALLAKLVPSNDGSDND